MQTNMILIKTKWSLLSLSLFILIQLAVNYILYKYLHLRYWQIILINCLDILLFYHYIFNRRYNFYINTNDKNIYQKNNDKYCVMNMTLIKVQYYTPFICLLKLTYLTTKNNIWIPIYIDSVPLLNYKQLRILSLWQ